MSEIALWLITSVLFMIGLVGTIIPGLPGIGIVYAGILFFAIMTGFSSIGTGAVVVLGIVAVLTMTANYLGSLAGSRYGGGKKYALAGTFAGMVAGAVFGGPPGIFIGSFIGALIGSVIEGNTQDKAVKVAIWSVIGVLGGTILQFLLTVILIAAFLLAVLV